MELHEKRIKATALVGEEREMSFDFNDHADEAARKDYLNERDCEHGKLRRSCPLCAAEADYAALLTRHNALVIEHAALLINNTALVEAVSWERECRDAKLPDAFYHYSDQRRRRIIDGHVALGYIRNAARAEVDRLLSEDK